jgi:hypothetical protein
MYVYIWKTPEGQPFYVGLTKNTRRMNPRNNGHRNWLCRQKLLELNVESVVIEFHIVTTVTDAQELERKLIEEYGRIQMGTGPLTNLREGGEGAKGMSDEGKERLRQRMLDPNHPIRSPEALAKKFARLNSPDVKALFLGEANPAKRPEVRAKIKAKWEDPEHRAKIIAARVGKKRNLPESTKNALRVALENNPGMQGWGERNGKDTEFDAKRIAGIRAAQPKRLAKMADPEALAQRKARLVATMNSEEFKAKRAERDTSEYRAKLSAAKKAYWVKRKSNQP